MKNSNKEKRLSPRQVTAIYTDRTRSQYQIAEQYGISQSMVSLIRSGRRWARLTADLPEYRRVDYRHTRSGRRRLNGAQVKDIYCSGLRKQTLADAYQVDRRTVERIRGGALHKAVTQHLSRSTSP
jgi:predicted transcriptional regulator